MGVPAEEHAIALGAYLALRMPPRVMPPGEVMSYSNHGMALAGHLVEAVAQTPFAVHMDKAVFQPLGMHASGFALEHVPAENLAMGYDNRFAPPRPVPYDYPLTVPASTLMSTAPDMARFMAAMLNGGALPEAMGGGRVLSEAMTARMLQQQASHHPDLPGRAYGFDETFENGVRVLNHNGLIWGFTSHLALIPEAGVGFFAVSNGHRGSVSGTARYRFIEQFFPPRFLETAKGAPDGFDERLARVAGHYQHNRRPRSTFLKFGTISTAFVKEVVVSGTAHPGVITVHTTFQPRGKRFYVETAPGRFKRMLPPGAEQHGEDRWRLADAPGLAFRLPERGPATHLFFGDSAYDRLAWWQTIPVLRAAAVGSLGVLLLSLLGVGVGAVYRRVRGMARPALAPAYNALGAMALMDVLFALSLGGVLLYLYAANPFAIGYGPPPGMRLALVFPLLGAGATVFAAYRVGTAWRRRTGAWWGRTIATFILAAGFLYLALLHYWNLLGYRFG